MALPLDDDDSCSEFLSVSVKTGPFETNLAAQLECIDEQKTTSKVVRVKVGCLKGVMEMREGLYDDD